MKKASSFWIQPFPLFGLQVTRLELLILFLAASLRLFFLGIKPVDFDEGINGWFVDEMLKKGYYAYDPANYHGPLHFYALFLSERFFGHNLWALRLTAILPSFLSVCLALCFRNLLGKIPALVAASFLAISPAMVFYGRYAIHESWLLLFSMLTAWGILALWQTGTRNALFATLAGLTGMILTKETYLIHLVSFLLAIPCLFLWNQLFPSKQLTPLAKQGWTWHHLSLAIALSLFAIVFFYSGTFLNWQGLTGLYKTFTIWFTTSKTSGHAKDAYQYGILNIYWLSLILRYEWPVLLGLLASFRFLAPSFLPIRYLAIYASGVLIAYSIIRYKTPWCIISIIWPFYFILGAIIQEFKRFTIVWILTLIIGIHSFVSTLVLNFWRFTSPKELYAYVQTSPRIYKFTQPLLDLAELSPKNYHLKGAVCLESYYPLPWILYRFTSIGYYSKDKLPKDLNLDFFAIQDTLVQEFESKIKGAYYRVPFSILAESVAYFRAETFSSVFSNPPIVQFPKPLAP